VIEADSGQQARAAKHGVNINADAF